MLTQYEHRLGQLNRCIEVAVSSLGLLMTVTVALQVFFRYVLNNSLFWAEELARYQLVWISFLGATIAYFRGIHPGVDVLFRQLAVSSQKRMQLLVHLVCIFFFTVVLLAGLQFSWFVRFQLSPAMGIPMWIVMSIIPFASLVLLLNAFCFLFKLWWRGNELG